LPAALSTSSTPFYLIKTLLYKSLHYYFRSPGLGICPLTSNYSSMYSVANVKKGNFGKKKKEAIMLQVNGKTLTRTMEELGRRTLEKEEEGLTHSRRVERKDRENLRILLYFSTPILFQPLGNLKTKMQLPAWH